MSAWRKANRSAPPRTSVDQRRRRRLVERVEHRVLASSRRSSPAAPRRTAGRSPPPGSASGSSPPRAARAAARSPRARPRECRAPRSSPRYVQRPPSWKSAPDSLRWRITSPMKKGFPSVSRRMAWASATQRSSSSWRGDRGHQRLDRRVVEAVQRHALDAALPPEIGQHGVSGCVRERSVSRYVPMTRSRIGSAERTRCFKQQQLRRAGPVEVVEDEHDRAAPATRRRAGPSPPRRAGSARSRPRPPAAPGRSGTRCASSGTRRASSPRGRATCAASTRSGACVT